MLQFFIYIILIFIDQATVPQGGKFQNSPQKCGEGQPLQHIVFIKLNEKISSSEMSFGRIRIHRRNTMITFEKFFMSTEEAIGSPHARAWATLLGEFGSDI